MRAAGYIRVSTSGQLDNTSLEDQAKQITEYCFLNNLELLPIYNEGSQSGADAERPELQRLLADARLQKFQFVVVREFSRFGRDVADMLYHNKILKKHNIKLISLKQQFSDDPYGEAMQQMTSIFDELERKIIKDRTHGGRNKLWKEKKRFIGHLPFGYRWDDETEKIVTVEEEATLYKQIVEDFLYKDRSMHYIAQKLNEQHRPSRMGRKWTTASISAICSRTIYYGYLVTNTHYMDKRGRIIGERPGEEHIQWENVPVLISKADWDDLQTKIKHAKSTSGGRPNKYKDTFLLHRLLKCGLCGGVVVPLVKHGKRYYTCRWSMTTSLDLQVNNRERCILPRIPAEMVEDWVWDQLAIKLGMEKEKHFSPLLEDTRFDEQITIQEAKSEAIAKTIAQRELGNKRLDEQIELAKDDDDYNPTEFRFKRRQFNNELKHLRQELEAAKKYLVELIEVKNDQEKFKTLIGDDALLSSLWLKMDDAPLTTKQQLLKGLLAEPVTLYPPSWLSDEQIKEMNARKHKGPSIDAVKSKPKFRYNQPILQEVLGVFKQSEKC